MTSANREWMDRDLAVLWHPCSQMKDHESLPLIPIRRGEGVWLEDFDGKCYLDAISSWWVNLFGHCHPAINAALADQLGRLEQVIFAGFSHEPGIRLAERLVDLTPPGLERCFYADNGSAAVEVALKMSFHYWRNLGRHGKTRFVTLENSYHGETLGALAVGDVPLYKETYRPLLMEALVAPSPDAYGREPGETEAGYAERRFRDMLEILERGADEICAVIVEPLVQCAGGMRMYDPLYLRLLREACDRLGIHLIADEIAVGFGRTGSLFACEQAGISPDFLCLSKGLTGGYLPLAAVLTRPEIYAAFYDDYGTQKAFLHSHSYTGNPLACRAALATLELFDETDVLGRNRELARCMADATERFQEHPHVAEVRQRGMILAIEMVKDKATRESYPWKERRGLRVYRRALERGVLLRPLGHVIYFMPPYVITPEQIRFMAEVAWEGLLVATED
ncbi:adenosylmethionine--8-amino-7-oxononanoate transaminase [Methylococcus mesophilus]|uniref:adenosylmethionine--8-amino-7-oxononanoate transaminase n=1 Tax=Methylococcus mesophilus TaxID=2993564 RepID=UPI00224A5BE4|nr:adenosylmethionine--8-amino-7-oxononanoate transaminase [Methylococcus mesophilus]UZR27585.1 adenosylmethionine--8-amino-7-oxononanoate transaminase [Methylococcus mesophilus]